MKKILLLIVASFFAIGANAQTPFYTEDFGSGAISGGMPTGWSAGTYSGPVTWHWASGPSSGLLSLGAMVSPSAYNGWMIFDADFTTIGGSTVPSGWLQSPMLDCSAHTTVRLSFADYYRRFSDSCFVWVGSDPTFATGSYTVYPVSLNNDLFNNMYTANSATAHINISATAASNPTVYVRYVYYGSPGGSYSWMIDDMSLSEMNPHDVSIGKSFMYQSNTTAYNSSIFSTPLQFADTVYPVTLLTNAGSSAEATVPVTAHISLGASTVFNQTVNFAGLAPTGYDSIVQFGGYKPSAIGNYTCLFSAAVTGDADLTNNNDTVSFNITDTTWMENAGQIMGEYISFDPGSGLTRMNGTRFDVPSTVTGDTVTGFGVSFGFASTPTNAGATVSVQLYSIDQASSSWTYVATSVARAVVTSDLPSGATLAWAYFAADNAGSGGIGSFVLQPGKSYAAIVQIHGVSTLLTVNATFASDATGFSGYFGQTDISANDGNPSFGAMSMATGIGSAVPMVRLYFGHSCPAPVAGTISGPSSVCVGNSVTLSATATGGTWASTLGVSVSPSGVVTGLAPGLDSIAYIVTTGCGTSYALYFVNVGVAPNAGAISGADTVCIGSTITLSETASGGVWTTSVGNALVSSTGTVAGLVAGVDTVKYTATATCGSAIATKVIVVTSCIDGVNDAKANSGISVYPNPAADGINVKSATMITKIQVMNLLGQDVYSAAVNSNEIFVDLKNQPSGVYIIRVNDTYNVRVVKN